MLAATHVRQAHTLAGARACARPWNPLHEDRSVTHRSSYLGLDRGEVISVLNRERIATPAEVQLAGLVRDWIMDPEYPCVGARSVFTSGVFRFGRYPNLGTALAARVVCHDLYEFGHEISCRGGRFASLVAAFRGPCINSEEEFERLLWLHLQAMHNVDVQYFAWDCAVSPDPQDAKFSFSIGERAYFVVGMHPHASRVARQFSMPALVFNPEQQFVSLNHSGKLKRFQKVVRNRDIALQGTVNPMLMDSPTQARQYSGRQTPMDWQCPLRVRTTS
jgi:uncharacterized protein